MSTSQIPQLSIDINSETLNNNNTSTTFSSSIQVPSIKGCDSTYSNTSNDISHNSQYSNDTTHINNENNNANTPTESYTKTSKIDLTIKLHQGEPNNNKKPTTNDTENIKQSVTPLTPKIKQSFTFNNENKTENKNYKVTVHTKTPTENNNNKNNNKKKKKKKKELDNNNNNVIVTEDDILGKFGYIKLKTITKTLQGNIFTAKHASTECVIKKTSKTLHNEHVTVQNGKKFGIYENILKECIILKYLTENRNGLIMTSFTKYENFFDDANNYYLSMEHGGSDLFDFIIEAHELINAKKLKIKEWRKFTKYLFWQMIVVLKWLHNDMNICHLDISLENILIKNGQFIPTNSDKTQFTINPNVQIKICDFGLAEIFNSKSFNCTKYCGKTNYKAPEVYNKRGVFDARKADVWSLGVVLFCMLVGSPPYNKPIESDQAYLYIKNGIIDQLLFQWERNHFITVKVLSLLHNMLSYNKNKRYLVDDVIKHPWLSLYFHKYKYQMAKKSQLQHAKNKKNKPRLPFYKLPQTINNSIINISQ